MKMPRLPIGDWFEAIIDWIEETFAILLDIIEWIIETVLEIFLGVFTYLSYDMPVIASPFIIIIILTVVAWWLSGIGMGIFTLVGFTLIHSMDLWPEFISTLASIIAAVIVALGIGIPIGILASRNEYVNALIRPVLDFMQTMPPFVYLIPAVIFFSLGVVPGVIATVIFAMPPAIRLTNLGIRQVDKEVIEAGKAFGSTANQLLFKIQIPLAIPTIMAGVNQTIMLALSMVVIASMIGAGGLGNIVLRGITQLNIGLGFEGGLAVVFLAIFLDRVTQSLQ